MARARRGVVPELAPLHAPVDSGRELLEAACENARALSRICDVLEAGPARAPELGQLGWDGAWILPEEL